MEYEDERASYHERLDGILDQRAAIKGGDGKDNLVSSHSVYAECLELAADVCGPEIIEKSFKPIWQSIDEEVAVLLTLRDRIGLAKRLFGSPGVTQYALRGDGKGDNLLEFAFDVDAIRADLLALANGDVVDLFSRKGGRQGRAPQQFAKVRLKLRALEWEACLTSKRRLNDNGDLRPISAIQRDIATAFGASSWDTVRHWRASCESILGTDLVVLLIVSAAAGLIEDFRGELNLASMRADGTRYIELMSGDAANH